MTQFFSFQALRRGFLDHECVCTGTKINKPESTAARLDLELLCKEVVKDGVSLIARHISSNEIVAVSFNKIQILSDEKSFFESFKDNKCKSEQSKSLMQFMINVDSRVDLFKIFDTNCLLEIMFLATIPEYMGKAIGHKLCEYSIELGRELKNGTFKGYLPSDLKNRKPKIVSAILTSTYSQKIGDRLDFQRIVEAFYNEFEFDGKTYSDRIGEIHPSSVLVAKPI